MITIFTTTKAINQSTDNTIRSLLELDPQPQILFFCNEVGPWAVQYEAVPEEPPKVAELFNRAKELAENSVLAYINADILLGQDFVDIINTVTLQSFLIVGHRWNVRVPGSIIFEPGWQKPLVKAGHLHNLTGADYFILPTDLSLDIPDFYIGRWAWDNWMILNATRQGIPVVDASDGIFALHQHHLWTHTVQDQCAVHNTLIWGEHQPKEGEGAIESADYRIDRQVQLTYTLEKKS